MFSLSRELDALSLKRTKRSLVGGDLFKAPWHIVYYHIVPYLDAAALAQVSLADIACSYLHVHRRDFMRQTIFKACQDSESVNSPADFAWDACFRKDFRWRFHTAWLAGMHVDDTLFYNHFKKSQSRAIDMVRRDTPVWNFLISCGAKEPTWHFPFGAYPP